MKRVKRILSVFIVIVMTLAFLQSPVTDAAGAPTAQKSKLTGAIVMHAGNPLAYSNEKETRLETANPLVVPFVKEGKTYVPIAFIANQLKAGIVWDGKNSSVKITYGKKQIKLVSKSRKATINKTQQNLDAPVETMNSRTFVTLGTIEKIFDINVFVDGKLIIISEKGTRFDAKTDKVLLDAQKLKFNKPLQVLSDSALKNLIKRAGVNLSIEYYTFDLDSPMERATTAVNEAVSQKADESVSSGASGGDYSGTNVQVQGVEEGDVVKTDGQYIYQVNKQRITVTKAYPPENMKLESTVDFEDKNFQPQEIYINGKHMTVIGTSYSQMPVYKPLNPKTEKIMPSYGFSSTKALIFDISDKGKIKKLREVEIEGYYISSRMIGSSLYVITNKNIWGWIGNSSFYDIYVKGANPEEFKGYNKEDLKKYMDSTMLPNYRDSAAGSSYKQVDYSKVFFFCDSVEANYLTVAGINIDNSAAGIDISSYLGAGQGIYASQQNLYVTAPKYEVTGFEIMEDVKPAVGVSRRPGILPVSRNDNTIVYKFALAGGKVSYSAKGEVPGTVLNQFSMDENGKHFRVATTKGDMWWTDENISKNNLYILDESMKITGKVEDMAPGEKIYSVRFMGDRGYIVTYRTVDPLFVLDLKDPAKPKVLGQLKIPGYSDYLHPYDENHIIGIGKDTVEMANKDEKGNVISTNAYYLGMKMAIFDVSDTTKPKELFSEKIGDRGTDSEILRNHKALLFSKEKNLLAFPVTLMEVQDKNNSEKGLQYGQFTYQGAYVFNIDLIKGFTLKGRITHLSDEDYKLAGSYWYDSDKNVQRILYIGNTFYTLSNSMIKATSMADMKELNALKLQ